MSTVTKIELGHKFIYKYKYRLWAACRTGEHEDCRAEIHTETHQRSDVYERCPCRCHKWADQ